MEHCVVVHVVVKVSANDRRGPNIVLQGHTPTEALVHVTIGDPCEKVTRTTQNMSLDGWVVRGAPRAPRAPPQPPPPDTAAETVAAALRAGATRAVAELASGSRVTATRPPPKKKRKRASQAGSGKSTASKGLLFTKVIAARVAPAKPQTIVAFSDVLVEAMHGVGDAVFEYLRRNTPLAKKSQVLRGAIAEAIVKRVYERELGKNVVAPEASTRVNGADRGEGHERYDFGVDDADGGGGAVATTTRRVEVKNSRMTYTPSLQYWKLQFQNVKRDLFDDLVLVFEGFDALRVYRWGGKGLTKNGKATVACGGHVHVCASRSQPNADASHAQLLGKMIKKGNVLLHTVRYDDPAYADLWSMTTRTSNLYQSVPMGTLSGCARGGIIENVVRLILARSGHVVAPAPITERVDGGKRGKQQTSCDFLLNDERAEVKSSLMGWNKDGNQYALQFQAVKFAESDHVFLAWMTPRGIHVFEHDGKMGVSTHGKETKANGKKINVRSQVGMTVASAAEKNLLRNFGWHRLSYLAFLSFAEGDAERVLEFGARGAAANAATAAAAASSSGAVEEEEEDNDDESGEEDESSDEEEGEEESDDEDEGEGESSDEEEGEEDGDE